MNVLKLLKENNNNSNFLAVQFLKLYESRILFIMVLQLKNVNSLIKYYNAVPEGEFFHPHLKLYFEVHDKWKR